MKKILIVLAMVGLYTLALWGAAGDESVVKTRGSDRRHMVSYPVWDVVVTGTWDDDDTADVTQAVTINGTIQKIVLQAPDSTNDSTCQVVIRDNEDVTIFDSGEQPENVDYAWSVHEPITGTIDVIVGISGAMGATNPDVVVVLRGI